MKTTFISTLNLNTSPRSFLPTLQKELAKATIETTTGTYADLGLALGVRVGQSVSLRQQHATFQAYIDSNAIASTQLDTAKVAVDDMLANANSFLKTLLAAPTDYSASVIQKQASDNLTALINTANSTDGSRYVFGGTNSGTAPLKDFSGAPQTAVDAAFSTAFGIALPAPPARPQNDPGVSTITAAQMRAFLNPNPLTPTVPSPFEALFEGAAWSGNWSNASTTDRTVQISPTEKATIALSANDTAIRELAKVYTMVSELGMANLSPEVQQVIVDKARELTGGAISDLTSMGATVGTLQSRVTQANERMETSSKSLNDRLLALEGVDPAEAKTRVDTLTTQIEMSYALTSQIMKLSIINYI